MDTEAPQQVAEEQQVPEGFNVVKEGSASILYPEGNQVFYNPVQEFNRDISILNLRLLAETLKSEGMPKAFF
jgi:tRNA (guanine26-N2/guanine27-N2)-dimethyltransferase